MLWTGLTSVILILIAFEDFKSRSVNILLFVALGLLLSYKSLQEYPVTIWALNIGINFAYLVVMMAACGGYIYWKYKRGLGNFIGAGDVIFLAIVSLLLDPILFLFFNTLSFIIALVSHVLLSSVSTRYVRAGTVPLAGFQSACLVPVVVFSGYLKVLL